MMAESRDCEIGTVIQAMGNEDCVKGENMQALPPVRLSQCMIVKNEEENIERALSWAGEAVFEQIVVDTGSTDRTVEIAEAMGAKVFHFEWINDFSAAKNYAIEQASGDWIAFLDADEFFSTEDVRKLLIFLKRIQETPEYWRNYFALKCPLVYIEDNGIPSSVYEQARIFRNLPAVRYVGRVHEHLGLNQTNVVQVDEIKIVHNDCSESARKDLIKSERNIELLRRELSENPDNLNTKAYLADSLHAKAMKSESANMDDLEEAEKLFREVIYTDGDISPVLKKKAYICFLLKYVNDDETTAECEELCLKALRETPGDLDYLFFHAAVQNKKGKYQTAWELLARCEEGIGGDTYLEAATFLPVNQTLLFEQFLLAAQGLGDVGSVIKYATLVLTADKSKQGLLSPYIYTLLKHGASEDDVSGILSGIYDFSNPGELLLIARAAKDCGATDFARRIMELAGKMLNK